MILNLEEVVQADGRLELLAAPDRLQESLKLLLTLRQELLGHLV